jgi:hypothetical protein
MVKMESSCLQRRGTVVFDTRLSCVTRDRLSYLKVCLIFFLSHFHSNLYPLRLFKQESVYNICATGFTQALFHHSNVVLDYKIQGLG